MIWSLLLDAIVAILLVLTIIYCRKLSIHLDIIRNSREELDQLINEFTRSTDKAKDSASSLKKTTDEMIGKLQSKIEKAEYVANDLDFLNEKANKLADRLSDHISGTGGKTSPPKHTVSPAAAKKTTAPETSRSDAQATMEKIAHKTMSRSEAEASEKKTDENDARTQAENDLLKALKSMR